MAAMSFDVPQLDLGPQLSGLSPELVAAAERVMSSRRFILGAELEAFESEFAAYCGVRHAIGVGSGTDALELALRAGGIKAGDEVITVAHTFVGTAFAIGAVGAVPVFVDVRAEDGLMDPACLQAAVTERTRAIVPVHLYGRCVEMAPVLRVARNHGLRVIEDAAQAHGATCDGHKAGALGDAGCFSFYPSKNLGAFGDGGAVVTDDSDIAASLRLLRNYGESRKYYHVTAGRNSRLDELQAAVLRVKLRHLDSFNASRCRIGESYREATVSSNAIHFLRFDPACDVMHQSVLRASDRDGLQRHLHRKRIQTQIHYPIPCHKQPVGAADWGGLSLPVTEMLAQQVLSLPMYPELSEAQVAAVCDALLDWSKHAV
jgi:dTDP-4-amino-4,6-dideoxygalactose transaminase